MTAIRRNRAPADDRGQTMVEFVIVMPALLMLLFGVIQFGIVYNNYLTVTDAARVGARKAAVSRSDPDRLAVIKAAVKTAAGDLDQSKLDPGITITAPTWVHGANVTVRACYPYDVNLLGFVVADGDVCSGTTERIE